jgi:hypothetical protein
MPLADATLHDRAQDLRHRFAAELLELDKRLGTETHDAGQVAELLVAGDAAALALVAPGSELAAAIASK